MTKKNTLHILLLLCISSSLFAQQSVPDDLRKDSAFFHEKLPELKTWMDNTGLSEVLTVDELQVDSGEITLRLKGNFVENNSDSLNAAWNNLRASFSAEHKRQLEEKLFRFFAFQMEVPEERARINIEGALKDRFQVNISSRNSQVLIDDNPLGTTGKGEIKIPRTKLKDIYAGSKDTLNNQTVKAVRVGITNFLVKYYAEKGTPYLYTARIDTSRTYFNAFAYDVTHLSHEILDEGYFEFHRIAVVIYQKNNEVIIQYDFQGKYGSGILFAPRKSLYKNMEVKYPNELKYYEENLVRKIDEYLRKL